MGRTPDGQRNTGQLAQPSAARSPLILTRNAVVLTGCKREAGSTSEALNTVLHGALFACVFTAPELAEVQFDAQSVEEREMYVLDGGEQMRSRRCCV